MGVTQYLPLAHEWESAGRRLLTEIGEGTGKSAFDVRCGAMVWLGLSSGWP